MRLISRLVALSLLAIGFATTAGAEYKEAMDPNGPARNAGSDYGIVDDNAKTNQSDVLQKAIEDLYAEGGVTLRMETGAVGDKTAIYDITGKNIVNENGRCAVTLGPHSAMNGVVKIDGIKYISSGYAVQIGKGGVKAAELEQYPEATDGTFARGSCVKNIHAIFRTHAQVKTPDFMAIPREYYDDLNLRWEDNRHG